MKGTEKFPFFMWFWSNFERLIGLVAYNLFVSFMFHYYVVCVRCVENFCLAVVTNRYKQLYGC
ncbi:hypothetical protein THOG11_140160 [Vibrio harveyi]|nr:hypothetical protein TH15OA1_480027 [Vibrio harveyi]CAH1551422.1 hypothetical protein THOD03_150150 [Vibrio harveyi]CAH1555945.1 hypothetical protein THOG11_140160 [Vibrio harveyi]